VPESGSPSASKSDLFKNLYVPENPENDDNPCEYGVTFVETDVDEDEEGIQVELDDE
jgi:hypothetical protein